MKAMACSSKIDEAMEFLEARQEGAFSFLIEHTLEHGGVVHCAPDCFLCGVPVVDDDGCLEVLFQCSHLPALRRVLLALPFERVRWKREFTGRKGYGVRERRIADFCRHEDYGTGLTKN